jgi:phosphatidylserine/phosphatidylglycerophosphate/cardiolipin synthase-like enzyme/V8-like Glu-specific endopeptidase
MPSEPGMPTSEALRSWLRGLRERDPDLHAELTGRLERHRQQRSIEQEGVSAESAGGVDLVLETIVREGRPALPVRGNRISGIEAAIDDASEAIMARLRAAAAAVEPVIPLVGRIDVDNHAGGLPYVGTGWLIDRDVVVTNRHVAELISRADGARFVFRPGRFGDPLRVAIDFRHELNVDATDPVAVQGIIWIETDPRRADVALLQVRRRTDGTFADKVRLSAADAEVNTHIVVVGYPARAPAHIIPDQAWMDRIYGGTYDVKRVAPGMTGLASHGWSTHDATTLGGNSGSLVVDMKTGCAVGLHFAGQFMIENYYVPASTLRQYLAAEPWRSRPQRDQPAKVEEVGVKRQAAAPGIRLTAGEVTITIPLEIKVSLGAPVVGPAVAEGDSSAAAAMKPAGGERPTRVLDAARALAREVAGDGALTVRHGYLLDARGLSDTPCLVVAAHPSRIDQVRARAPQNFQGFPVDVRPAALRDQVGGTDAPAEEAGFKIAYNDDDRRGQGFSFDWVEEEMEALLHVGPEHSWSVLADFLAHTKDQLVSSIYEFHARHIADALEAELEEGRRLKLVMAPQSRDPRSGNLAAGDFERGPRFRAWGADFGDRFDRIFVPVGNGGLVAKSYHIKVTVRDGDTLWLSSGNWKRASQPNIPVADLDDPKVTGKAGNREWHVVVKNPTLAQRYSNHILADYEQCLSLGGTEEAVEEPIFVDVPLSTMEAMQLEAAPTKVFPPLPLKRSVRVKPLLTPDHQGEVYAAAVLKLIRSAKQQLLFQNQYIAVSDTSGGLFSELVEALVERSREIEDVRIILRSGGDGFWDNMAELKRRGMDVNKCVRRISATHTKGIVVDGRKVLVGSQNWSSLGVTLNRDASLLFDDAEIAQYFADVFEHDWDRASETAQPEAVFAGAPRLADPSQPTLPGYVRMTLEEYLEG